MLLTYLRALLGQVHSEEEGQTAIEYAAVILLVAIVIAGALAVGLDGVIDDVVTDIKAKL